MLIFLNKAISIYNIFYHFFLSSAFPITDILLTLEFNPHNPTVPIILILYCIKIS